MSQPTPGQPPVNPGYPHHYQPPAWQPAPQPAKKRTGRIVLLAVLGVLGLCVTAGAIGALVDDGKPAGTGSALAPLPQDKCGGGLCDTDNPTAAPAVAAPAKPKISDFKITPKITEKHCYGSAGCNVTLRIDLSYGGPDFDDDTTWLIVYEIHGVEDAPHIGNLELTGEKYTSQEEYVQTKSSKSKITVKITSLDKD